MNLTQAWMRLGGLGNEPPSGVVVADLIRARDDPATAAYVDVGVPSNRDGGPGGIGAPGGGYPFSFSTAYYGSLIDDRATWTVDRFRGFGSMGYYVAPFTKLSRLPPDKFAARLAKEVNADAKLQRVVVWTATDYPKEGTKDDPPPRPRRSRPRRRLDAHFGRRLRGPRPLDVGAVQRHAPAGLRTGFTPFGDQAGRLPAYNCSAYGRFVNRGTNSLR